VPNPNDFERLAEELTKKMLVEHRAILTAASLSPDYRGLQVWKVGPADRHSELSVEFRREGRLVDILEFAVVKNGEPNATLEEIESWLRAELTDLRRRHPT